MQRVCLKEGERGKVVVACVGGREEGRKEGRGKVVVCVIREKGREEEKWWWRVWEGGREEGRKEEEKWW